MPCYIIDKRYLRVWFMIKANILKLEDVLKSKKLLDYRVDNKPFELFEKSFNEYREEIKTSIANKESEEHCKNDFNKFISSVYKYKINTKDRLDSVIFNSNDNVNTIIEFKRPVGNDTEMINDNDFNRKALHEIIFYYFKEIENTKNNDYINNLVISNGQILYFFNAYDFKSKILKNKSINTFLKAYNGQTLETIKKTADVYNRLENILANEDVELNAIRIDLLDDDLNNEHVYKMFDKYFLFNKKLENDTNIICDSFYKELIHIMGLKESDSKLVKSDTKNTLLDITIDIIQDKDDTFDKALNLNILWINRILFLKILESILRVFRNDNDFYILNPKDIKTFADFNTLFFNVLAKVRTDRKNTKYDNIPYLNSSLFEKAENEYPISELENDLPIEVMKGSVLYNDKDFHATELTLLDYLLRFLECYKFNSDEANTDNHTVIKSSVLGLVFEKLNGYKDGSHFTPSVITMYMSRTVIEAMVVDKFNEAFSETSFDDYEEVKNYATGNAHKKVYKDCAKEAIDSIKIIDPACGSGHFLVSCLNELIRIKSDLLLLDNRIEVVIENDELIVFYRNTDNEFVYKINDEHIDKAAQEIQEIIFNTKLHIIENQLYGVDLNVNSVNICRLRLWIEMIKSSYYTDNNYIDLMILPNLEFKVVAGDTLIKPMYDTMFFTADDMAELRKNMRDYYNASYDKKKIIKQTILSIIAKLKENTEQKEILDYEPFNILAKNSFFDSPLMFGIDKFDIVIMNPPYFTLTGSHNYMSFIGKGDKKTIDIYQLFLEQASKMVADNGFVHAIISNKWMRAEYGRRTRQWLYLNTKVLELIDLGADWFESATVDTNTILYKNSKQVQTGLTTVDKIKSYKMNKTTSIDEEKNNATVQRFIEMNPKGDSYVISSDVEKSIFKKDIKTIKTLEEWDITINRGVVTGFNEAFIIDKVTKDKLIAEDSSSIEILKPLLRGKDLRRYSYDFADKWLIATFPALNLNIDNYPSVKKYLESFGKRLEQTGLKGSRSDTGYKWFETQSTTSYYNDFEKPKIIYGEISKSLPFTIDINNSYTNNKCFILTDNSNNINCLYFLLAIFNSKVGHFWIKRNTAPLGNDRFELRFIFMKNMPIAVPTKKQEADIVKLVKSVIDLKSKGEDTSKIESQIDSVVYGLYGLSSNEIKVVESLK